MPPPAPPTPGGPKQMPKWAWPVAIGGGLLIGFFLLKKQPEQYEEEEESDYHDGAGQRGGGGGGALPIPPDLGALGLTPPTWDFGGAGTGYGYEGGEAGGPSDGSEIAISSQFDIRSLLPAYSTSPVSSGQVPTASGGSQTPVYQQAPSGSIPSPSGSTPATTPSGGGGSIANKAQ